MTCAIHPVIKQQICSVNAAQKAMKNHLWNCFQDAIFPVFLKIPFLTSYLPQVDIWDSNAYIRTPAYWGVYDNQDFVCKYLYLGIGIGVEVQKNVHRCIPRWWLSCQW